MTRRNGEYGPDPEHERARPEPSLSNPGRERGGKPDWINDRSAEGGLAWWEDKDKFSSIMATASLISLFVIVLILVFAVVIRVAGKIAGLD